MKKYHFIILFFMVFLAACGGGSADSGAASEAKSEGGADMSKNPDYQKGLALVAKSDCLTCHEINKPKIGPTYRDVAAKYEDTEENIAKLAATIIKGSSGVWGTVPMTAHPTLSEEDARQMVKYILLLK
jgi:cytochrome c